MKKKYQTYFIKDNLPNLLGELIFLAVKDLSLIEKNKKFEINMNQWYSPNFVDESCQVCFAGCIIAQRLGNGNEIRDPNMFSRAIKHKLLALDQVRRYNIIGALEEMCNAGVYNKEQKLFIKILRIIREEEEIIANYDFANHDDIIPFEYDDNPDDIRPFKYNDNPDDIRPFKYNDNPEAFKRNMLKISKILKKYKL